MKLGAVITEQKIESGRRRRRRRRNEGKKDPEKRSIFSFQMTHRRVAESTGKTLIDAITKCNARLVTPYKTSQ
jgi:hypothetical protein